MDKLEKVLNSWKHVVGTDRGSLNKQVMEHILETIKLLEELKKRRGDLCRMP